MIYSNVQASMSHDVETKNYKLIHNIFRTISLCS